MTDWVEIPTYAYMGNGTEEWTYNNSIVDVKIVEEDDAGYDTHVGFLYGNYEADALFIDIQETLDPEGTIPLDTPRFPVFNIAIDDEILFVYDRNPVIENGILVANVFRYSVNRGIDGTEAYRHFDESYVATNSMAILTDPGTAPPQWTDWMNIPRADSPDNYPNGKYAGEPSKLGSDGTYLFEYSSQDEYEAWLIPQGQANGLQFDLSGIIHKYRSPISSLTTIAQTQELNNPEEVLGSLPITVTTTVLPSGPNDTYTLIDNNGYPVVDSGGVSG